MRYSLLLIIIFVFFVFTSHAQTGIYNISEVELFVKITESDKNFLTDTLTIGNTTLICFYDFFVKKIDEYKGTNKKTFYYKDNSLIFIKNFSFDKEISFQGRYKNVNKREEPLYLELSEFYKSIFENNFPQVNFANMQQQINERTKEFFYTYEINKLKLEKVDSLITRNNKNLYVKSYEMWTSNEDDDDELFLFYSGKLSEDLKKSIIEKEHNLMKDIIIIDKRTGKEYPMPDIIFIKPNQIRNYQSLN